MPIAGTLESVSFAGPSRIPIGSGALVLILQLFQLPDVHFKHNLFYCQDHAQRRYPHSPSATFTKTAPLVLTGRYNTE